LSVILGFFISFSLKKAGQNWAQTFSNSTTFVLLPLIGYVITSVISGDIALSLGMVGALSIIRFRHPVKSPLELSIYFLLLSIGITISSNWEKAIVLATLSMLVVYLYSHFKLRKQSFSDKLPTNQFIKEEPNYIIDITCYKKDNSITKNLSLIFSFENKEDAIFKYKLGFNNKMEVDRVLENISKDSNVKEFQYTCI
jgi:hypothetical protein